jgi:YgiT-type zinc finger domain-containing protein
MKCIDCKHGDLRKGMVTVSFDKEGCTTVIKDVPADVCNVCSSWCLDEETTEKVTALGQRAADNGAEMEIIRLKAA